ncbi:hypothetical protein EsH8_III_000255 [Colletotrichum jinshuiense]
MAASTEQPQVYDPQTEDDSSSIGGSSFDDSLASLRSSILDYRRENGRTYHKLSDGKYLLPNDEREKDRLDFAHHLWKLTWDGELCNCPKKDGAKRVLDIGTGTGIWALDFADEHPEATVYGVDLSPIQPGFVPPNCQFEIDDIEKEWTWSEPFDFIFARSMNGSFANRAEFIANAFDNLEPGGYVEMQDNVFPVFCEDNTMKKDSQVLKWSQLLVEGANLGGRSLSDGLSSKKMLEDAGFVDVQEKLEKWPISPRFQNDPKLKELGVWCQAITLQSVETIALATFTRVLGWGREETLVFCAGVRDELKKQNVNGYFQAYSTWGRKPEKQEETETP